MILTQMNYTADLVAQELYKIKFLQPFVARTYSQAREDIFNVKIKELPEYSIIYKMLYKTTEMREQFVKEVTTVKSGQKLAQLEKRQQAAKFQVEYYFGQTNYHKDEYLQSKEDPEGWIDLKIINSFPKMKAF